MTELKMGMEVQTRDGRPARIVAEMEHDIYPLVVVFWDNSCECCDAFTRDGKFSQENTEPFIIPKPQTRTVWVVSHSDYSSVYSSEIVAKRMAKRCLEKGHEGVSLTQHEIPVGNYKPEDK